MLFLDVGAHDGQTLREVLRHPFDRIFAFEPMPVQHRNLLRDFTDPRLQILRYGLSDRSGTMPVYGTNDDMEASVYPDKVDVDRVACTWCEFVEASRFFHDHVEPPVIVKLNCEGSEIAILNNLIESGQVWKITNVMIDFDVRKIPGMEHLEAELLDRFEQIGFHNFSLCDDVMKGETHQDRIAHWLDSIGY
jgi:FkbM family methyltransferase